MSDPSTVPAWTVAPARPPVPAGSRLPSPAPRPAPSWFGEPASTRPSPTPRAVPPAPSRVPAASWLSPPAPVAVAPPAPIVAVPVEVEPVPSVAEVVPDPDLGVQPEPLPAGIVAPVEPASDAVSAEPDPEQIEGAEEGGLEPTAIPVFPLERVSDNCRSWTPEPADDEPSTALVIGHPIDLPTLSGEASPDALDDAVAAFAAASKSGATRRAYLSDLRDFTAWCRVEGVEARPSTPRTVSRYLTALAGLGRSVSTVNRRAAAIAYAHRLAGLDSPTGAEEVRAVLTGIRNTVGRRPAKKKALTADLVAKVVRRIPSDMVGLRDRAMILLCFAAALRRSELVALDVADLEEHRRGLLVLLRKSKSDQAGEGRTVAVLDGKLKVPAAVRAWLDAAEIAEGPVFRGCDRGVLSADGLSDRQFARVLKARCADVGLDPNLIGGHSPRRGFATSADDAGADLRATSEHLRHAKLETTAGYMEAGDKFRKNAGKGFV